LRPDVEVPLPAAPSPTATNRLRPRWTSSTDLQQRLVQEADANYKDGADLVMTNEPEMYQLDVDTELFLPLQTPMADAMNPDVVHDNWVGYSANAFVVAWNTNAIKEAPKSFEEVFTKFQGRTVMEITDWEWFGSLVTQYFMGELGWTEDKAVDLFKQLAAGSAVSDGHTLMNTMVIAGEYDISVASYFNRTQGDVEEGAPIAWEPAVTPLLVRPAAQGIHKFADRPATALLFIEYMLTDAQQMMADNNFIPLMAEGAPNPLEGYDVIFQDTATLIEEESHWRPLYEEVLREAKGEVLTDEE
jgi:iron(III) transport system substrate-binding protein